MFGDKLRDDSFDDFLGIDAPAGTNFITIDPYGFAVVGELRPQVEPLYQPAPSDPDWVMPAYLPGGSDWVPPTKRSNGVTGSWDSDQTPYQAGSWGDQFLQNAGDMLDGAWAGSVEAFKTVVDEYKSDEGVKFDPRASMDEVFAGSALAVTSIPGFMSKLGPVGKIIKGVTPYATAAVALGAGTYAVYKAQEEGKSLYDSMYQGGAAATDTLTRFAGWVGSTPKRMFNAWEEDTKNLGGEGFAVPESQQTSKQVGFDGSVSYEW